MVRRTLRRISLLSALAFAVITLACQFAPMGGALAQRGGGRSGGAAARPAPSTRPSQGAAQRPAQPSSRPPAASTRPSGGANIQGGSTNISGSRNTNIDRDVNINNDVDIDVDGGWGWDDDWDYPAGAFIGTAIIVGAIVSTIPPTCQPVLISGTTYQSCNGVLYQPVYQGTTVQYQVVQVP